MSLLLDEHIYKPKSNIICVYQLPCEFYYNQHTFFEHIGKLRFVEINKRTSEDGSIVGFIEFDEEDESVAKKLICKGYVDIEDKIYHVKAYNEYIRDIKQPPAKILKLDDDAKNDLLLQPPDQDSPKHILNALNEDCLYKIFEKLHFSTLILAATVCIHFNRIAKIAFSSKYKFKKISIVDLEWNRQPKLSQVETFLSEFGSSISSLSLRKRSISRYRKRDIEGTDLLLKMINKYCKSLDELEFDALSVDEQTFYEIRALFERLRILRINHLTTESIFDIISVCSELKILDIHFSGSEKFGKIILPNTIFPKLVEVHIRFPNNRDDIDSKAIQRFTELNSKLKILKLWLAFKLFTANLSKLDELNEFEIILEKFNFPPLIVKTLSSQNVQIENLQLFIANWHYPAGMEHEIIETISKFRTVTEIRFRFVQTLNTDVLILLLKKLPNIKSLSFDLYKLKDFDAISKNECFIIKSIIQHANQLSELTFMTQNKLRHYPIGNAEYYDILKSVESRLNGIKLTIEFLFETDEFSDNESQSIVIFNKVPNLLTIHQRNNVRSYEYSI